MEKKVPPGIDICISCFLLWLGFFCGWSTVSIPLTLGGAPFWSLGMAGIGGVIGAVLAVSVKEQFLQFVESPDLSSVPLRIPRESLQLSWLIISGIILVVTTLYYIVTSNLTPLWFLALIIPLVNLIMVKDGPSFTCENIGSEESKSLRQREKTCTIGLVFFILSIILLYWVTLRPDADDAFYLNLPIGIKAGLTGMMEFDTMLGVDDWPILGSNYRVETLPTLIAAVSWLTGLPVIHVSHFLLPVIWCFIFGVTIFIIGYALFSRDWWIFGLLTVIFFIGFAGKHQSWGVHFVSRFFHGKGPLLCIVIPLIVFIVVQSHRLRIKKSFTLALLTALQIMALGLTANSIYLAPLTLGLPLASNFIAWDKQDWKRLFLICAAIPALSAGVYLMLFDTPVPSSSGGMAGDKNMGFWNMVSQKYLLVIFIGFIWYVAHSPLLTRRSKWPAAYLLVCLVFVINPFLWPYYREYVTGQLNFRLYWTLPIPMFLAVVLTLQLRLYSRKVHLGVLATAAILVFLPGSLYQTRGTTLNPSLLKVPPLEYSVARWINEHGGTNELILAHEEVATWVPANEDHQSIIYSRRLYFDHSRFVVEAGRLEPREELADWINGITGDKSAEDISASLIDQCVTLLVHRNKNTTLTPDISRVISLSDGEYVESVLGYTIYRLPDHCINGSSNVSKKIY